ncbi:MAG: hypothetical protein V7K92_11505, partial [Nostoc sp.]
MKESVISQDIVQKEAFKLISRQLKRRFGNIDTLLFEQQGYFILKSCLSVSKPKEQSRWACAIFLNIWS